MVENKTEEENNQLKEKDEPTVAQNEENDVQDNNEEIEPRTSTEETIHRNSSPKIEDFDWEEYENMGNKGSYSNPVRREMEKAYAQTLSELKEKEVIKGTIVGMTDKDAVLNIGFKSDGLIPLSELKYNPDCKVGDIIDIIVENREDKNGQVVISHRKALAENAWEKVLAIHQNDTIVQGYIKDRTKGGMVVDLMGLDAFLPGSQLDVKPIKDYDAYIGTTIDLKVVKLNPDYRNIVVSHKAIIESDLEQQKSEILSKLEKGQILEGVVKNLTTFGVFVDLGGVDGLIHITDVSWGRINHPEEVLEIGQKVNVVVIDYDEDKKRISLGMKQLTPHPWETLPADIEEGSIITGKVVNIEDYGAFVEILPGIEGLIHVSEMSWSTHLKSPQEYVKLDDEIQAKVLAIDREERKLSIGLKQLLPDPWADIEEKFPVGSAHSAIVRSMTNFGLFMELAEGIDGLLHISDLSWTRKYGHPAEFTKTGEAIDVVILGIEKENRRLSLGHKQLEEDPWDTFESIFLEGSEHQGIIHTIDEKGAVISLPYGVEAYAPKKHMAKADKTRPVVDESLDFRVIEFDKGNRRILLSHTNIWKDAERARRDQEGGERRNAEERTRQDIKKVKANVEKTTLADESDILSTLKNKMEAQDKAKQKEAMAKMDKKKKKLPEDSASETIPDQTVASEVAPDEAPAPKVKAPAKPKVKKKTVKTEESPAPEATESSNTVEETPTKPKAKRTKKATPESGLKAED